jgi:hypothetical protein
MKLHHQKAFQYTFVSVLIFFDPLETIFIFSHFFPLNLSDNNSHGFVFPPTSQDQFLFTLVGSNAFYTQKWDYALRVCP